MAKKAYIGVDSIARQVKKMYVGVDNVARKIKKAYIGVGGVARPCYTGGELSYYGVIATISGGSCYSATTVGDYGIFEGGSSKTAVTSTFTETSISNYPYTDMHAWSAATTIGDYALIAGGSDDSSINNTDNVDGYNSSLTYFYVDPLEEARRWLGATTIGDYALFAGGIGEDYTATCDAYNSSLTHQLADYLLYPTNSVYGTTVGEYALFAGHAQAENDMGDTDWWVSVYDTSLCQCASLDELGLGVEVTSATTIGDHAIFTGRGTKRVVSIDSSMTISDTVSLPLLPESNGEHMEAITIGDYALIRGITDQFEEITVMYDNSLTQTIPQLTGIAVSGQLTASTVVGNYAIFIGLKYRPGSTMGSFCDAYTIQ